MVRLNLDGKPEFDQEVGEDTWELFEAIEDSFGVDLGDYHEVCGISIRELAAIMSKKTNRSKAERCLSAVAFYKLRRAFVSLFGVPRGAIRPTEAVTQLLPSKDRNMQWGLLQEHLGLNLPRLSYPIWIPLLALATPPTLLILLKAHWRVPLGAIWIFDISCALYLVIFVSLIPAIDQRFELPRVLPKSCETFGDLVRIVSTHNYAALGGSYREDDVVMALRQLVSMQTSTSADEISPDARIPNDLNIY